MKEYVIDVKLVFGGKVTVKADTIHDARSIVQKHIHACQPTISGDDDERIIDLDINSHADTEVWFKQNNGD